ncbi:precorrin-6Y C5,15-methyltransferase (decarboxylating), CbiT subunit [[Leptolyngbya] sp. PCC 7376]|uniref:precorrin-6Y C5,15-methyltransferase subunit CbiT n=1 Tax=[Leptolyngbya] sp. PCC 7376 TaxID=111781 RepID=UPI00029EE90D|nr:precorrin-6Y C5,15-methyltransferase subunit CbiT [[Leptolyngbya] sp. PCC 7376]AFY37528.1 precorrin-6Y C5,15-methyltransferase (decarboxylating), CbiT subunit [[Leptolyngbya] sp. PCC 7376]
MWHYQTPGIPDQLFERLPGIPMTKREARLLIISALRMEPKSVLWDIGAGTGTISIEIALLCPGAKVIAVERDEDVAELVRANSKRFKRKNISVFEGNAPECFADISAKPDRICLGGGNPIKDLLHKAWSFLPAGGRAVAMATNLEQLYQLSEGFAELQARNVEVVQAAINRLETQGMRQVFAAVDPMFILSGEKID